MSIGHHIDNCNEQRNLKTQLCVTLILEAIRDFYRKEIHDIVIIDDRSIQSRGVQLKCCVHTNDIDFRVLRLIKNAFPFSRNWWGVFAIN